MAVFIFLVDNGLSILTKRVSVMYEVDHQDVMGGTCLCYCIS